MLNKYILKLQKPIKNGPVAIAKHRLKFSQTPRLSVKIRRKVLI
jgi:hypothetical protein